jgi:tRNA U55 pseudouridine synthase TruB
MRAKSVKMGFLGTLDPNADGVLVLLCGRYTKMADKLHEGDKTYHTLLQTFFRQSKAGIAVAVEEKVRYHIL